MPLRFFILLFLISFNLDAKVFLDQNDDLLKHAGIYFDSSGRSQLCGPVSVVNWLQFKLLRNQKSGFKKTELVTLLLTHRDQQNIDQGFTETELLDFVKKVDVASKEKIKPSAPTKASVFGQQASLLMIGTYEERSSRFYHPDYEPYRSFHWVLKVNANEKEHWIEFIDPEQPESVTRMHVEVQKSGMNSTFQLHSLNPNDLKLQKYPGKKTWSQINWLIELE